MSDRCPYWVEFVPITNHPKNTTVESLSTRTSPVCVNQEFTTLEAATESCIKRFDCGHRPKKLPYIVEIDCQTWVCYNYDDKLVAVIEHESKYTGATNGE